MLLLTCFVLAFLGVISIPVGIILAATKKLPQMGRILITAGSFITLTFLVFAAVVILTFISVHVVFWSILLAIGGLLLVILIGSVAWNQLKKKAVWIPLVSCFVLCGITIGGFLLYQNYVSNLPTVGENKNLLAEYAPYAANTKAVSLDRESILKFSEDEEIPRMDGATALYPIYSAFAKAVYPKNLIDNISIVHKTNIHHQDRRVPNNRYLQCNTTPDAYENIVTGEADIIFVAAPSEDQAQFAKDNGVELVYTPIGKEAFVFMVNSRNPIDNLTVDQIQQIYSGQLTDWNELGVWGLGKIKAFQRDQGSGSQSALERLMDGKNLAVPPQENVISGMGGIISQTADYKNYRNSLGFSFRFYSTEMVQNQQIKLLSLNGVKPSLENIENGTYPIASEFYAVTRKDASENTKRLLEWIQGEQGQELVEKTGYTPMIKRKGETK